MVKTQLILTFSLVLFVCSALDAAQKAYVVKKDGSKIYADRITADSRGVLTIAQGKVKRKMNPRDYQRAWIPKPADVSKAYGSLKAKKYREAGDTFIKLASKYKYLGWGNYCAFMAGQAYMKGGQNSDAISALNQIKRPAENADRETKKIYLLANKLLADLYVKTGKYSQAEKALEALFNSNNDSLVCFANNLYGNMLLKQGKTDDAKLSYMKTAFLFDASNKKERPEALFKIIQILKKEKNNKAIEFEKKLKADYPDSKYISDL